MRHCPSRSWAYFGVYQLLDISILWFQHANGAISNSRNLAGAAAITTANRRTTNTLLSERRNFVGLHGQDRI